MKAVIYEFKTGKQVGEAVINSGAIGRGNKSIKQNWKKLAYHTDKDSIQLMQSRMEEELNLPKISWV